MIVLFLGMENICHCTSLQVNQHDVFDNSYYGMAVSILIRWVMQQVLEKGIPLHV